MAPRPRRADRPEPQSRSPWPRTSADNGRYPAKLDDLAPKYLATVPGDVFSGKPLIYKPTEKGYLFYSVGPNGKDEEGRWYDDDPPATTRA